MSHIISIVDTRDEIITIPLGYVVAVVTVLAGAVGILFKLYIGSQKEIRSLERELIREKDEKVNILAEVKRLLQEKLRRKRGSNDVH
jgi:hypothetical protein